MKQSLSFITIGVKNLELMKNFYKNQLGWSTIKEDQGIVFFKMNGFILALFPEEELAADIGIPHDGSGFKRMSFALNFNSEKEVDDNYQELLKKGVNFIKKPDKVFWGGYHCYFADPENNYWEMAYNPFLEMDANGNVSSHR